MTIVNFEKSCEYVKEAIRTQGELGVKEIQLILRCSLPSTRKYIRSMLETGIMYEINSLHGKRYVKESPEERNAIEIQKIRERLNSEMQVRRRKSPMVFLCKGKTTAGNRVFEECKLNSPIQRMDDLLRAAGKFY